MNGRNNAGDNVYHCRECVSLGKLIYLAVAFLYIVIGLAVVGIDPTLSQGIGMPDVVVNV